MELPEDQGYEEIRRCSRDILADYLSSSGDDVTERGGLLSTLSGANSGSGGASTTSTIVGELASHRLGDIGTDVDGVVPTNLPEEVCSRAADVHQETVTSLYNIEAAVTMTRDRAVARVDMVVMYLRSFRNIMEHDLNDSEYLHKRFNKYFNEILSQLLSRLYEDELKQGVKISDALLKELEKARSVH